MEIRPEACAALMIVQIIAAVILKLLFFSLPPHTTSKCHPMDHIVKMTDLLTVMRAFGDKALRGQSHKVGRAKSRAPRRRLWLSAVVTSVGLRLM